jgi:phosphatidylserine/phosphatidylglycerophosphate/cardiolipin synthase-like enzyme
MNDSLISPKANARFVVTLPPAPSRIGSQLEQLAGSAFLTLTDTKDAFLSLANRAKDKLVIMTPFIDSSGAAWAADLFGSTEARQRVLIVRSLAQLDGSGPFGARLRAATTTLLEYEFIPSPGDPSPKETFHAKIVLADGVAAYVGSANFLYRSKESNLECGFLLDGDAVAPVALLIESVIRAISGDP